MSPGGSSSWTPTGPRTAASTQSQASATSRAATHFTQADLKRQSRDASPAAQAVSLEYWQDHAKLIYGDEAVEVTREMTAVEVAEALESLESIRDVWISGGGTAEDPEAPWHVVFLDADLAADGNPYPLLREVSVQRMTRQLDVTTVVDTQEPVVEQTRGSITLPVDIAGAVFSRQDKSVQIDLLGVVGPDEIKNALSSLGAGSDIVVEGSGTFDDPWIITIRDYDVADPVTVEYEFGGLQALAGSSASYQVIERLSDDGTWAVELNDADQYAVYSTATDTAGSAVYLSAYQTVERHVPRLLEKPVWADLDGDGVVEETGETDWFEDPTWVNDQRVDTVHINGSDDFDDYFLIGHEVLNAGGDAEEKHTDTVQVTHQRLDGHPFIDGRHHAARAGSE